MKTGAENRKKTVLLGVLIAGAVCGVLYNLYSVFGPNTPPPSVVPVASTTTARPTTTRPGTTPVTSASPAAAGSRTTGATPQALAGVPAQRLASSSASLDPTLDQAAMLRTESLVYAGSGRNIFSANYTPPPVIPKNVPPARPNARPIAAAPTMPQGPPPPPPIPLRFFGTAQRPQGVKQAFLLSGEDVYLAGPGDVVAKRYRVDAIQAFGVQVTDLTNNNTQTLPMQQQ